MVAEGKVSHEQTEDSSDKNYIVSPAAKRVSLQSDSVLPNSHLYRLLEFNLTFYEKYEQMSSFAVVLAGHLIAQ